MGALIAARAAIGFEAELKVRDVAAGQVEESRLDFKNDLVYAQERIGRSMREGE